MSGQQPQQLPATTPLAPSNPSPSPASAALLLHPPPPPPPPPATSAPPPPPPPPAVAAAATTTTATTVSPVSSAGPMSAGSGSSAPAPFPHCGDPALNEQEKELKRRLKRLYPAVDEQETPLPRSWSPKDKFSYIGLSQNNLRVHYKGEGGGGR